MGKSSKDTYGAQGARSLLDFAPEKLVIVTDPKHPLYDERVELPVDESLVLNIMHQGVLEPVLVRRNPDTGDAEIVDGRQRVRATIEANKRLAAQGMPTLLVPAVVRKGDDNAQFGAMISTNEIRQADTPLVRAGKMRRAVERGYTEAQVGTLFGVTTTSVKAHLGVLEASAPVRNALDAGRITASDAFRLSKLPREEQETKLEELMVSAPKEAGKRRRRGTLKRAPDASGPTPAVTSAVGVPRSRAEVQAFLEKVRTFEALRENDREVAISMLKWVLGDDDAIDLAAFEDMGSETPAGELPSIAREPEGAAAE